MLCPQIVQKRSLLTKLTDYGQQTRRKEDLEGPRNAQGAPTMSRVVVKDQACLGTGSARAALLSLASMLLLSSHYELPPKDSIHARAGHYLLKSHFLSQEAEYYLWRSLSNFKSQARETLKAMSATLAGKFVDVADGGE
jgi:hypothetical protein